MSGIQGTFNTAVQGMNTEAHAMSVISTNIANVTTTAYKKEDSHFETILNHILPNNQKFLAVKAVDSRDVDHQGQITTTNRTYDLAVNGKGFMVTNTEQDGSGIWQYTRDGALFGKAVTLSTTTNGTTQLDQGTLFTTSAGAYVYGWPANADGTFTETNDLSSLRPMQFATNAVFPSQATTNIQMLANLSAGTQGRQSVGLPFIDATGTSRTLTIGFNSGLSTDWTLDANASNGAPVTIDPPTLSFGGDGIVTTPADGKFTVTVDDPSGPQTMTVDLSKMTSYASNGNVTVNTINQDGYIEGRLNTTYFTSEGVLTGSYSNGQVKALYKLPLAQFQAENNLEALPGNYFVQTDTSGALSLIGLGSQGTSTGGTAFVPGALEASSVDLADQFSKMIITQRAYSSNAQVLKAADEMTQAARDLKR